MTRWLERIMEFMPFEIQHRQGKLHSNADGLSRIPLNAAQSAEENIMITDYSDVVSVAKPELETTKVCQIGQADTWYHNWSLGPLNGWSLKEIAALQDAETNITLAKSWVDKGERPIRNYVEGSSRELWSIWSQFDRLKVVNGILYRVWYEDETERLQLWVPRSLIPAVLKSLHDYSGHLGCAKTIDKVRTRFHWFELRNDIELYIQQCTVCQRVKDPVRRNRGELRNIASGYPLERIGIDIVGPLPKTEQGNSYIVVMVDYFTKFPFAFPLKDISAETVANVLMDQVICVF